MTRATASILTPGARVRHLGVTWIWIVVVLLVVIAFFVGIMAVFAKTTAKSHGGVEEPKGRRRRGDPPFESIERGP